MPRGGKRPGAGKKAGVPEKITGELRLDLIATLRSEGFDPVVSLVQINQEAMKRYEQRWKKSTNGFGALGYLNIARESAKDLMEFVYPKRKSVELTGAEGKDLFQSFTDLVKQIADEKKEL